jgi:hypothetical protein
MATLVRNAFITEAKQAEHFSVMSDLISHADHVSEDYFQKDVSIHSLPEAASQ